VEQFISEAQSECVVVAIETLLLAFVIGQNVFASVIGMVGVAVFVFVSEDTRPQRRGGTDSCSFWYEFSLAGQPGLRFRKPTWGELTEGG